MQIASVRSTRRPSGRASLPISALKAASRCCRTRELDAHPTDVRAIPLSRFSANAVNEAEARSVRVVRGSCVRRAAVPGRGRANVNPWTEVKVNTVNPDRGRCSSSSGEKDNKVPWAHRDASYKRRSESGRDRDQGDADRGHALVIDNGWKEVAARRWAFVKPSSDRADRSHKPRCRAPLEAAPFVVRDGFARRGWTKSWNRGAAATAEVARPARCASTTRRGVAHDEQLPRVDPRPRRPGAACRIAADDAIHDHNVALSTWLAAWANHPALDAVAHPFYSAGRRRRPRTWRQLDADRARRPAFSSSIWMAPMPLLPRAPSVAVDALRLQEVDDPARRPIKAAAAILTRFGAGRPLAETHRYPSASSSRSRFQPACFGGRVHPARLCLSSAQSLLRVVT